MRSCSSASAWRRSAWLVLPLALWAADASAQRWRDEEIRKILIDDSIARFGGGECPCPYSYAWNGKQCADNSAYMKRVPNLYCYPQDVPYYEIRNFRERNGG